MAGIADDIDAGIIKHSGWIIAAAKKLTPEQRKKYGSAAVGACINMAEALAGQGMNDKARLQLVGTPAAAITAPRWLNMPAGKAELAMPGSVTLLEFSAHWCTPCKESYPGVNRLRQKYGRQGFRAVLATQLYGYFEQERDLAPVEEFDRNRKYFAEHGMMWRSLSATGFQRPLRIRTRPTARLESFRRFI